MAKPATCSAKLGINAGRHHRELSAAWHPREVQEEAARSFQDKLSWVNSVVGP